MRRLLATILVALACVGQAGGQPLPATAAIDALVRQRMAAERVVGLAYAIVDDGRVSHVAAFGLRDLAGRRPLTTDTVMYGASLTKTAFAYVVLQLADEGRIDLDRSIADYLPRPLPAYRRYRDLGGDERWRRLTPRIILQHATGFANFRRFEPDRRLRFYWDPGTRYGYSGEGLQLLQFVLEQGLRIDLAGEMRRRVFDRFGMTRTEMIWRADFEDDHADGYDEQGHVVPHDRRDAADAAGSMDTTIADQARLWAGLVRGDGLSAVGRAAMTQGRLPIRTAGQFPTLAPSQDPRGAAIGLAAGMGVITFRDARGPMWFKGGHDDGTGNTAVCQERGRRCVVFLSNSVRAERLYPELVAAILGPNAMPWWWEYGPQP